MLQPCLSSATLARIDDGRTIVIYRGGPATPNVKLCTLPEEVAGVSGLWWDQSKTAVQVIKVTQSGELLLAMLGNTATRSKLLGVLCNVCGLKLNDKRNLSNHMKQHDTTGGMFVCPRCHGVFRDSYFFKAHKIICHFPCPFTKTTNCKFKAKTVSEVEKHTSRKHKYDSI